MDIEGISSVRLLAEKFGRMPDELRLRLRPKLLAAAAIIQRAAQVNARWSSRIPGAIKAGASTSRTGGALVRVSRTQAPHARPYEGAGTPGATFRHPVFTKDVWVSERKRSFLFPAVKSEQAESMAVIAEAVKSATSL